ncbi:putative nucleic acid-binding protein [Kineosphaera limosa]|uniref:Ribonuclease VapC n=1 Tax=Kineosphaera limosa NBRC 100340 TaxID=1184609 RepID=K6WM96_9MICO|nr:type II toxin-antitoxin system VapC family toxin [Kineosphaera limosa]NYE00898.1 putative nucleic acid-binding protein [Kineosphaera limosa]GAB94906.1 hypothetical protein KILIM_014_00420 [Kineosphaera limosa NBRC 100340]
MIVVDSSVLAVALVDDGADGARARSRLRGERLAAPAIIDLEVLSVLRGLVRSSQVTAARAQTAIEDLVALPLRRAAHPALLNRSWQLRHSLSAYDAAYVALAEALEVPLVTGDGRLDRATGPTCRIEVLDVSR